MIRMGVKGIIGALCLAMAVFATTAVGGLAADADATAAPTGTVQVSGPAELQVPADDATEFQLQVMSRLECHKGFEAPMDLVVAPTRAAEQYFRIDPSSARLAWEPSPAEPNVYVIDALVTFNVTSRAAPDAPTETEAVLLVQEVKEKSTRLRCGVEGYSLTFDDHEMSIIVLPQDAESAAEGTRLERDPPVQWLPMLLAVSILSALALFASVREKKRRSG